MAFHKTYNKQNVVEEYKKRFQQILEFTTPSSNVIGEEGEEPVNNDDGMDPNAMDGNIPMDGGQAPVEGDPNVIPQNDDMDPNVMDSNQSQDGDLTSGFNPQELDSNIPMEGDPNAVGGDMPMDTMQPNDEVVDITELTDAQEETLEGIEEFDEKFVKAFKAIKNIETLINKNNEQINAKIADIENEIKRRNPTATEKMSNRQSISYPYTISPEEYWREKEKNTNYSTENDENGVNQEQFVITNADINNATDWKNISDSLNDDFLYNQTLNKVLKF